MRVTETERRGLSVLELKTRGRMGKIIGRQGRTAAALRTLLAVTAEKHGKRAQLDIQGLDQVPKPNPQLPNGLGVLGFGIWI